MLACLPPDDAAAPARRALHRRLFAASRRLHHAHATRANVHTAPSTPFGASSRWSGGGGLAEDDRPGARLPCVAVALVVAQLLLRPPAWALRGAHGAGLAHARSVGAASNAAAPLVAGEAWSTGVEVGHGAAALARGLRVAQALSDGAEPDALLGGGEASSHSGAEANYASDAAVANAATARQLLPGGPPSLAELQVTRGSPLCLP